MVHLLEVLLVMKFMVSQELKQQLKTVENERDEALAVYNTVQSSQEQALQNIQVGVVLL